MGSLLEPDQRNQTGSSRDRADYCRQRLPELRLLERLIRKGSGLVRSRILAELPDGDHKLPLYALEFGTESPELPVLILCGGVHGIERIGTQLLLAELGSLVYRLPWDDSLQHTLERMRLILLPLINPVGMARGWRSNGNGVDLMRNAPLDADQPSPWPVCGHRLGNWLPWYRGKTQAPMQAEAQQLCTYIQAQTELAPFILSLDCHSGFGMRDRIWFPYAGRHQLMEHAAELQAMLRLFERAHPHHPYLFEPQYHHYCTHGDLWDHLYQQHLARSSAAFLPLTLEMGSWLWVRKNLSQITSYTGLFNPMVPHRQRRTLRRHHLLLDFLICAVSSWQNWLPDSTSRTRHMRYAERRWLKRERKGE
ncbi:peptidase M14 [Marinobacterium zhoushanense]|uniref:Peptidase M14 n=1 Tax=Marinobacterium zhoushanense TaxID=1679163 RepID=A0ABQ1KNW4_9GAMM|nr:M14 family zinc carboxypeptidase [Marinobacterium zhoushanense]GGC05863.1 peptidase M14 [Marinobacterium zhoushanense]